MEKVSLSNETLEKLFELMTKVKCTDENEIRSFHALFELLEEPVILFEEKAKSMQEEWKELIEKSVKTELKQEVRDEAKAKAEQIGEDFKEIHKCRVELLLNADNIDTIKTVIKKSCDTGLVTGRPTIRNLNEIIESVCI